MTKPLRQDEIRLIIKPADAPADSTRPIPAKVLQRTFSTVLRSLKVADAELHDKAHRSEFFISHLAMGSNEIGVFEQPRSASPISSIDLFRQIAGSIYRSEFDRAAESENVAKSVVAVGKVVDVDFPAVALFPTDSIPLDGFFAKQADRLRQTMSNSGLKSLFFAGSAIGAFDGTLGEIDYRGPTWTGQLVLPGGGVQIECVFNRSMGEDAFNRYGNKRVSVSGRAIYTGDSQLPQRIEVKTIEEVPLAREAIDIRGSLSGKRYFGVRGTSDGKNLQ